MDEEELTSVVIENGSANCRFGIAGEDVPRGSIRMIVNGEGEPVGIDNELINKQPPQIDSFDYVVHNGCITDWEGIERIWSRVFEELNLEPANQPLLMTQPLYAPHAAQERIAQVAFEKFNVPNFCLTPEPRLNLYSSGRGSGIVVGVGDGITYSAPYYESFEQSQASQRIDVGGRNLTDSFVDMLRKRDYSFCTAAEVDIVRFVKENMCYVAKDYQTEVTRFAGRYRSTSPFVLPDGRVIDIGDEAFKCPELLFCSEKLNSDYPGVARLIYKTIHKCDIDTRKDICANIIMSGGCTQFPGFAERLQADLVDLLPGSLRPRIVSYPERLLLTWIGGSIFASLSSFKGQTVSKEDYYEIGPRNIHS